MAFRSAVEPTPGYGLAHAAHGRSGTPTACHGRGEADHQGHDGEGTMHCRHAIVRPGAVPVTYAPSVSVRSRSIDLDAPLDLAATIGTGHGPRDPTRWVENGCIWQTTLTSEGPATLRIWQEEQRVHAETWGDGADTLLELVPELLGCHDDPDAFEPKHDVIADAHRKNRGLRLGRGRSALEVMVPIILGQRVTGKEAADSYRQMVFDLGERAPGPKKMRLPPTPKAVCRVPLYALHRYGIERSRGVTILEACRHPRFIARAAKLDGADAVEHLMKLPGVGKWTANLTVAGAFGWSDAVPVGDFHIKNMVAWALAGEARGSDERMLELLEPYRGQRWRALRLLFARGIHAPKRGPKRAGFNTYVELAESRRR
jgi:3-methyladenine DNA glycosylase/8-oxoguanine DNA glycosylase